MAARQSIPNGAGSSREALPFADRADAGGRLARRLSHLSRSDVIVLGLPRGGVPVAAEVARVLRAPLDVIVVRKLGVPRRPELAMGAIGEDGCRVLDRTTVALEHVTDRQVHTVERRERAALNSRVRGLREARGPVDLAGRTVVIVDDGIATGATAQVACQVARLRGAAAIVVAVPVGPPSAIGAAAAADDIIVLETPDPFRAVGLWYRDFTPVTDREVAGLLADAAERPEGRS